jgi:small-conductance mechanosensitive channel
MIWWLQCACGAIALGVCLWAVLDTRVKTRIFGTLCFSCVGLVAALHMQRNHALIRALPDAVVLMFSIALALLAVAMLLHYLERSFTQDFYDRRETL